MKLIFLKRAPVYQQGFSLLEILVVLTIFTLIFLILYPNSQTNDNESILAQQSLLISSLQDAREKAILASQAVSICVAHLNEQTCDTSSQRNWKNGWYIYYGKTLNENNLIFHQEKLKKHHVIKDNFRGWLSFNLFGGLNQNGSIYICQKRPLHSTRLVLINTGRVRHESGKYDECN